MGVPEIEARLSQPVKVISSSVIPFLQNSASCEHAPCAALRPCCVVQILMFCRNLYVLDMFNVPPHCPTPCAGLQVCSSEEALGQRLVTWVADVASDAVAERGAFSVAFAGGSLLGLLKGLKKSEGVDWSKWHIFTVDERVVPHGCVRLIIPWNSFVCLTLNKGVA